MKPAAAALVLSCTFSLVLVGKGERVLGAWYVLIKDHDDVFSLKKTLH